MNLLLGRDQKSAAFFSLVPLRIGSGVIFHLRAELELDEEEWRLLETYKFSRAILTGSDPIDDLKKAFRPALLLGFIVFVFLSFILSVWSAIPLSMLVTLVMTFVYFKTMREQIIVSDLLNGGRTFLCDSIVELIHKEAFLEWAGEYLRQVLESAKHWHDRGIIPIRPLDKEAAKLLIRKASRA